MAVILTTSEDMISEAEKRKQEQIIIKQAQQKVEKKVRSEADEKKQIQDQELQRIKDENERLRKEKEELLIQSQMPKEDILLKQTQNNQEIEKAKDYYKNKNEEIEELIDAVMKSFKKGEDAVPSNLRDQSDSTVSSLLRFLIQIVMQNYGGEGEQNNMINNMDSEARKEVTKKNLLEMLKSEQSYKMNVFGSEGGMAVLNSKELSRQDKVNLIRLGVGKNLLDPETEAKLMATEPRMEVEIHDPYKASTISFKFVAVKTPIQTNNNINIPQKLYFTFKFFTFQAMTTEKVVMKLPPEEESRLQQSLNKQNQSELNQNVKVKLGSQYYLVRLASLMQQNIDPNIPQGVSQQLQQLQNQINTQSVQQTSLQLIFDVDPSISQVPDENLHLSRYLKDRVLTIDLWNGDSLMHYGTCKVPLHMIMRQGEPSKVVAQEFDVCEPDNGQYVGGLQLLITNEGRKIPIQDKEQIQPNGQSLSQQPQQKHKKKVLSKPIENFHSVVDGQLSTLAQNYEFTKSNMTTMHQSEDARKKLRVERLKRQTAGIEITQNSHTLIQSFNDPQANEWDKMQTLKQIEMIRETKKHSLLSKVLKESMATKQKIDVVPGQPSLIHFIVQNPFPQDEVFSIIISDPDSQLFTTNNMDPEMQLIHNENREWQFWFNEGKCNRPEAWDIVSSKHDLLLRSGQQCPLLFKFLSYREPVSEGIMNIKQKDKKQPYNPTPQQLIPRKLKVTVLSRDQMPISTMEVKILPREQFCDQIFRYYEPQQQKTFIKIPNFVPFSLQTGMVVKCSNHQMKADIMPQEGNKIFVITQTERAPKKQDSFIFIYSDQYCSQLLACCKIEIYALLCIKQKLQAAGPETVYQLQVRSQGKRTIEVFSSNPRLVFPPGKKDRNLQLLQPGELTNINIGVRASTSGIQRARIHCVDVNTKELVQAWLFEVEADKPNLQKAYQIQITLGRHTPYKFAYTNPLNEFIALEFVSSKPNLMEVRRERQSFEKQETKHIDLYIPPQMRAGQEEVILYINDESGKISESLFFKIIINT